MFRRGGLWERQWPGTALARGDGLREPTWRQLRLCRQVLAAAGTRAAVLAVLLGMLLICGFSAWTLLRHREGAQGLWLARGLLISLAAIVLLVGRRLWQQGHEIAALRREVARLRRELGRGSPL